MPTRPPTAAARAYEQLRAEILDGRIRPGTTLYEVEQSSRLGVSRTPVREAFRRLVADGLLTANGGRGLVVTQVSERDLASIFELRACLEAQAAELAARRGDPEEFAGFVLAFTEAQGRLTAGNVTEQDVADYYALIRRFDAAVDEAAQNPFLVDALDNLRTHAARVRRMASHSPARLAASAVEHALIAEAIAAADPALAVHATHVHLHNSLAHFRAVLAPGPAAPSSTD
ncbi:MAG TPA: GntR family transcriptional regulator [Intrasporangium sp.]|nr:GntR family transcriptional regulator [Intrasporangium sp.]